LNERVLILDDEAHVIGVLAEYLESEGYACTSTTSPMEAMDHLRGSVQFTTLLTDLKMPEMHGIEVVREAKQIDGDLAIIVVTGLSDIKNAIQAMRLGAEDYVLKPFDLSEISLSVSRAIEKRELLIQRREHERELELRVREATQDLERTNTELRATKQYLENLIHSTVDAIITTDDAGMVTFVNEGAVRMLGYPRDEWCGRPLEQVLAGGREEAWHVRRLLDDCGTLQNYEIDLTHRNGFAVPASMSLSFVRDADGTVASILAICKDITRQKQLERELKEMSIKDSLTDLYNQRYFYDRLQAEIERAKRQNHPLSLLLFDVDQFKTYNDCHGHLEGDNVLQTTGRIVMDCTREHVDLGFRYGGDEFTVILPEADEAQAHAIAERIRQAFEGQRFDSLTVSIGLMTYREGYSLRTFIQFTDAMMFDAKRSGGNQIYVYRPPTDSAQESA
jgi:diguanylate cyclase (GGDEF)-like protein/PAS domain S-box-containing protein